MLKRIFLFLGWALAGWAQQIGQNAPSDGSGTVTFNAGTQLVVEAVTVTDSQGQPVEGLNAKNFAVTEDGVPQDIRFFEYQNLNAAAAPAPSDPSRVHIYNKLGRTTLTPERPGESHYKDRRLLALYFDMTALPDADQVRALRAAEKFIRTQMTSVDRMAIMRYAGASVDVLQDFTADRDRLLSIIETMVVGEGKGFGESSDDASSADTGAAFGQDDSEFNIFNTDRQLSALQTAATMLGQFNEKKLLIYFASGLRLNGLSNQAQLRATVNSAIRAGVSFWPIDARGLVAEAPLGDATMGSPGNLGMYSGTGALANTSNLQRSQDTLYSLAADTGGKALLDYNDLAKGIHDAEQSLSNYYVIGYYSSNTARDGKFRRIKISLSSSQPDNLSYRQGYFASKQFSKFTAADKERQLEDALMLPDPITELTIATEIDYFQINRAEYFVPLVVKIPGRELALAKRGGAEHTVIDFIGEIKDAFGTTITNVRDRVDVKLNNATAAELVKRTIEYDSGFTLLPGNYVIKFLARDNETGRIGTFQTAFTIPNLNKVQTSLPISSVILGSQRVDWKDALYNATKYKAASESANPLVQNGSKLIPSVTRVFSRNRPLYVYLQAYEPGVSTTQPVFAKMTFYRAQQKVFESQPIAVTQSWENRLKTLPLSFEIALDGLTPGEYDCQVSALNPLANKVAFWRARIRVVP